MFINKLGESPYYPLPYSQKTIKLLNMMNIIQVKRRSMIRLFLIMHLILLPLVMSSPAQGTPWNIKGATYSENTARRLDHWIDTHQDALYREFDPEECQLLKRLVKGILIWIHQNGNSFEPDRFLDLFSNRDKSIMHYALHREGMLLLLKNTFIKIGLDHSVPLDLPPHIQAHFPPEGRWYASLGSGNETILFYFNTVDLSPEAIWHLE